MEFTSIATGMGVTERAFALEVAGERVPGILWTPEDAQGVRPLLLVGHGGTQHKRIDTILARARSFVRHHGYAVAAIDAPGHGERTTPEQAARAREAIAARMAGGRREMSSEQRRVMAERNVQAVPEWQQTLTALQQIDEVGKGPVGYWGVSMGTAIGVPFVAAEPRVQASVFGLAGLWSGRDAFAEAARSITVPILFLFQWGDELVSHEAGLALYDAFGSREKTMHINPGGHVEIPAFERESTESFFVRHLGSAKGT